MLVVNISVRRRYRSLLAPTELSSEEGARAISLGLQLGGATLVTRELIHICDDSLDRVIHRAGMPTREIAAHQARLRATASDNLFAWL